ncbi:MFS transporter [bacterium]|nr:MAG: MFS transporter [bacterium]
MAGFFPVFFKEYWSAGAPVSLSTFRLGAANSSAGLLVALLAPALGAIADRGGARKKFLIFFALTGIAATASLYFIPQGEWLFAAFSYMLAMIGFMGGNIFYDSLIVTVSPRNRLDFVSSLGFSLGYLGGGLLFALNVLMVRNPEFFGLSSAGEAVKLSFAMAALWWGIFLVPLLLAVKEAKGLGRKGQNPVRKGFSDLAETFRHIKSLRPVYLFLIAYWLYIDGVDTIIVMAVDYGMSLGFPASSLMVALLITQFVGFPSAIAFGKLGERFGVLKALYGGLFIYCCVVVWGYFMDSAGEFYAMAIAIGLAQGGVQALSRSWFARLVPEEKAAQFFGFYNMLGKFAAVIGPLLMGLAGLVTGSPRTSILALLLLLGGGIIMLRYSSTAVASEGGERL